MLAIGLVSCLARAARAAPPDEDASPSEPPGAASAGAPGLFEGSLGAPLSRPESGAARASATLPSVAMHGYTRADVFAGKVVGRRAAELKAGYAELMLRLELDEHEYGGAHADVRVRSGLDGVAPGTEVDLREAYVNAYLGPVDLRFGHQVIVWGRADAFNPTNNLTPIDLRFRSPVEDDRRLANLAARLWVDLAPLRIEGAWLPLYAASEIPNIELPQFVSASDPSFPAPRLVNGSGAVRVHVELAAVEGSLSYLNGYAPLPGLALRDYTVGVDPPVVRIARKAYRQHVLGLDLSTALGEIATVRGEAAYRHPLHTEQAHVPRRDLQYVLGVDHDFGELDLIVQYLGRYVFDWRRETGPERPIDPQALIDFMEPLPAFLRDSIEGSIEAELRLRNQIVFSQRARVQHLLSARPEWRTLNDTLSLSALALVNLTTREWLLYPKLVYELSDWISGSVGAELYVGPDGSLFGLIDDTLSAGYVELRVSF